MAEQRKVVHSPIWFVMGLSTNGVLSIFAADTEHWVAEAHRKMAEHAKAWKQPPFSNVVRIWIEKRETNHFYGISMIEKTDLSVMFTTEELRLLGYNEEFLKDTNRI